jgi:hypothetical protein
MHQKRAGNHVDLHVNCQLFSSDFIIKVDEKILVKITIQYFTKIFSDLGLLTRENGTDTLSRNVGKQLPHDTA